MPPNLDFSKELIVSINGLIAETAVEAIKDLSEEVAGEMDKLYYSFFKELYDSVKGAGTSTPGRFMSGMGKEGDSSGNWRPLTQLWSDRKIIAGGSEDFYHGLTGHLVKAKRKIKRKKKRKSSAKKGSTKPFLKFLLELKGKSRSTTRAAFGPLTTNYYISAKGRKTPIKMEQKGNIITELGRITSHGESGRIISNYQNVTLNADISMFPLLATIQSFSEWYAVDYLSKKSGMDKDQWMKVNSTVGFGGGTRPIRAIVTPLISWYATTGLTSIMRKFYS